VTKRDLIIGIAVVVLLVAATILAIWLVSRGSSDEKAFVQVMRAGQPAS
jgi:hypothetical protein